MRFSVAALLGGVGLVSVGCAALFQSTAGWVIVIFTGTVGALFGSTLGAIYCRPPMSAFWRGFAVFGWGYFILVFGWLHNELSVGETDHVLATGWLLERAGVKVIGAIPHAPVFAPRIIAGDHIGVVDRENVRRWQHWLQIGQALWTVVFALLGAFLARWLYSRQGRA